MQIIRYTSDYKEQWDKFVDVSKNGTFLLKRDYMDYHSDRFKDCSFLFYDEKKRLLAVLPTNIAEDTLYSHQGLTYGGMILSREITSVQVLNLFEELFSLLKSEEFKIKKIYYKPVPHIYHTYPAEEDLYALFRNKATIAKRLLSCVIARENNIPFSRVRNRHVKKAINAGMKVCESKDFYPFWKVLTQRLNDKYGEKPVHTVEEISLLHTRFPDEIRLFEARIGECVVGGCVIYVMKDLVHIQYSSATEEGMENGALDLLFDYVANHEFIGKKYIDIGTSNEQDGWFLNESLIFRKETCGGRAIVFDTYELDLI